MKNWLAILVTLVGAILFFSCGIVSVYSLFLWNHKFLGIAAIVFWSAIGYQAIGEIRGESK